MKLKDLHDLYPYNEVTTIALHELLKKDLVTKEFVDKYFHHKRMNQITLMLPTEGKVAFTKARLLINKYKDLEI